MVIGQGATVTNAYLRFRARSSEAGAANFLILGYDTDDAAVWTGADSSIQALPATTDTVMWSGVPDWTDLGYYNTVDISSIMNEILARPGWTSGNSMSFMIMWDGLTGNNNRESYTFESDAAAAPKLVFTYLEIPQSYIIEADTNTYPAGFTRRLPALVRQQ